jgi:methylenetetrahydrofolate reductase (NADPH)
MRIVDKLVAGAPAFSFEFFPPKDEAGQEQLYRTIAALRGYEPAYVSVTYGAGGSTRRLTVDLVRRIKAEAGLETMAHLTCVGSTAEDVAQVLDQIRDAKVENVLALRGDPPKGEACFVKTDGGFEYASELIEFIKARYSFCLAAACYPEKHVEAADPDTDLANLKRKVDAGVELLVTQLFFRPEDYFVFVDKARSVGITVPIIPGIMPITNLSQIKRFTSMCGARIPEQLLARLEATAGDAEAVRRIGVEHAIRQCPALLDGGAPGVHFYTLNRSRATVEILEALRRA